MTRHLPARLARRVGLALLTLGVAAPAMAQPEAESPPPATPGAECAALATTPWPRSAQAQTALLRRMEAAVQACSGDALFLAAYGGAWLEVGDARQAVLWLERALMLNPAMEAAQADHALALAALGEPAARDELVRAWQGRADVPPVVWKRLTQPLSDNGNGAVASGDAAPPRGWVQFLEVQLLLGHESNLNESPRLTELTITPPDGPVTLPLAQPLEPRSGAATLLDMSWQGAISPEPQRTFLLGVQASARHAPGNSDTDWKSLRLAFSASERTGRWRWQLQGRAQLTDGKFNEDGRQWRWNLAADGPAGPCSQRWAIEREIRHYENTAFNDAKVSALATSVLCAVPGTTGWAMGLFGRWAQDRARYEERPGGDQQQRSLGLRLVADLGRAGPAGGPWTVDAQWRTGDVKDERGYSPLLENNARRETRNQQLNFEITGPWLDMPLKHAETVIQAQLSQEKSNLPLFSFDTASIYAGLRFKW